jgi:hypothetical protein
MVGRGRDGTGERDRLERAARQLGVTSSILRQHGWKTASPARVKAAAVDARWAPEAKRAKREARQLAGEAESWAGAGADRPGTGRLLSGGQLPGLRAPTAGTGG